MHKTYEKASKIFLDFNNGSIFFCPLKSFQLKWLIDSNSKKGEYLLNGKTKRAKKGERKG